MPPAMSYTPDDKDMRNAASDELKARRVSNAKAWEYYRGQHPKSLKTKKGEPDDSTVVNLFRQAVDRTKAFLVPAMPRLELGDDVDTAEDKWLEDVWKANKGAKLLHKMVMNGCCAGHIFTRTMKSQTEFPRVINLNPANILCFWQADDFETLLWYEIHWTVGKVEYRQDIVNLGTAWEIRDYKRSIETASNNPSAEAAWTFTGMDPWNYPLGPIVDWQHLEDPQNYYGMGEADNLELNDSVNKKASDISRILRYHASPRNFGSGFKADKITQTAIDNFWTVENPQAKLTTLEMKSDLMSSMNFIQFLTSAYMAERRIVVLAGDVADFQRVTNLGTRVLFLDQINKNDELQLNYEDGIQGISQRLQMLAGKDYSQKATVHWIDALPQDPKEQMDVLTEQAGLGIVSKETMARETGRNWKQEQENIEQEGSDKAGLMERLLNSGSFGSDSGAAGRPAGGLNNGQGGPNADQ